VNAFVFPPQKFKKKEKRKEKGEQGRKADKVESESQAMSRGTPHADHKNSGSVG